MSVYNFLYEECYSIPIRTLEFLIYFREVGLHEAALMYYLWKYWILLSSSTEDNPYEARPCPVCHKFISNRANLKKHLKIRHSAQEEAFCLYCHKVFRNKYSLWTHINSYHPGVKSANHHDSSNAPDASSTLPGSSGSNLTSSSSSSHSTGYMGP